MAPPPIVIPPETSITGRIDTPADVIVEGQCEGHLAVGGRLTVAAGASCRVTIRARTARIYGEVIGNIVCTESIVVASGARVVGDLRAPDISIDSGCEIDGRVDLLPPAADEAELERVALTTRGPAPRRPKPPRSDPETR